MVDNEFSKENSKSSKVSTSAIIKNLEMLKFVPVHTKAKETCKHAVKKLPLPFITRYILD